MTVEELAAKVLEMRKLQADYFKTRTGEALRASKVAEAALDRLCRDIVGPKPTLF